MSLPDMQIATPINECTAKWGGGPDVTHQTPWPEAQMTVTSITRRLVSMAAPEATDAALGPCIGMTEK